MRGLAASICLVGVACGGDAAGPTTSHQLAGDWNYVTWNLQDGYGATCGTDLTQLKLTQHGVTFDGQVLFGMMTCTWGSNSSSANMGAGKVGTGIIAGDSVSFTFDKGQWRSFGVMVTPDSMAGIANAVYSNGSTFILTGYWSATRQ